MARRSISSVKDGETYIVQVECCEGEEGQIACLLSCQKMRCPLYQRAVTASLAICIPHGYTPTHENVLSVARIISDNDNCDPDEAFPLDGLDEEERPLRDARDDDLWEWDDERE